jgi:RimJ/RimL family protein N-acetyltransferase
MIPPFPIKTARLILRPLAPTDADAVYRLYADWEVSKQLSRITFPFTHEAAHQFITDAQHGFANMGTYILAMVEQLTGACVGIISLRIPSRDPASPPEWQDEERGLGILGYSVNRSAWRQGYASESATALIHLAFTTLGLTRIQATPLRDNLASRRVLERLGFSMEEAGILEEPLYGGPARIADGYLLKRTEWVQNEETDHDCY